LTGATTRGKSESVTFRIESEALRNLRREAGYLASLYQFLFDELGQNKRIEFDNTENTLAFTIDI
jgi:hypothetical protein